MAELAVRKEQKGFAVMLAYPEFFKLFIGQTVSRLGDSIDAIALMWMMYKLTDSPLMMATVMFFNALPSLLFGIFSGVFIDRWDRKKVLIFGDVGRGLVAGIIAYLYFAGVMQPWYLFVSTFVISTMEVFSSPARSAVIPAMIQKEHLMAANSLFSLVSSICEIIGVGVASAIVGYFGIAAAILIDALSFWFCAVMTLLTKIPKLPVNTTKLDLAQYRVELRDGFQVLRRNKIVLICSLFGAFANFVLAPIGVLFPLFSDKVLGKGATGFALLSACFSTGVLIGSLIIGQFGDRMKRKSRFIQAGITGLGFGFFALGFTGEMWLAGFWMAVAGMSLPVASVSFGTLIQQYTPPDKMGRVAAFSRTLTMGGIPLGIMLGGIFSEVIPVDRFFNLIGILVIVSIGVTSLLREFREV